MQTVHYEGLTKENAHAFQRRLESLQQFEQHKPAGDSPIEQLMLSEYRDDLLQIGAPGRLLLSGELNAVSPADETEALDAANPVREGAVEFDAAANERREDPIVAKVLQPGGTAIVVLGGGHDLSDNVPDGCEYVRQETRRYGAVARE